MTQLMRGPSRLREIVGSYLADTMPQMLVLARAEYQREAHQLPDPIRYDMYEPWAAPEYPVIGMYVTGDSNLRKVDYSDHMEALFHVTYQTRIFVSVRSPVDNQDVAEEPEHEWAIRCRDEMTTVLRACLLSQPSLGYPEECELQEDTLSTDYPDIMLAKSQSKRYIAAGIISVDIRMVESLSLLKIGQADRINVNPALLD